MLEKTAKDYSDYVLQDIKNKLDPINQTVDIMLAHLEEFQTIISFAHQEVKDSTAVMASLEQYEAPLRQLFSRIDTLECAIQNIKNNFDFLEQEVEKSEERLGYNDSSIVTSILNPFFKKHSDGKEKSHPMVPFKSENYFKPV